MTHPEADRLNELAERDERYDFVSLRDIARLTRLDALRALPNHHDTKVTEEGIGE